MTDRETYRLMCLFGDLTGTTPTMADGGRLKHLRTLGYSPSQIEDGLRGVDAVLDGKLTLPEGALHWAKRPFTVGLLLFRDYTSGRRVIDLAGDAWRRGKTVEGRGGTEDVATVLRNLGAL